MIKKINRKLARSKRSFRIRKKISGSAERPRMSIFRSLNNIFVQLIDDVNGVTLVSSSTLDKELKDGAKGVLNSNANSAKIVGESIAKRALDLKIKKVVFDRSGYVFTGVVKALADSARANGLEF